MNDQHQKLLMDVIAVTSIASSWNVQSVINLTGAVLGCVWLGLQIYGWFEGRRKK